MKLKNPPPRVRPDESVSGQTIDIKLGHRGRGFCGFDPTALHLEFPQEPPRKWYDGEPSAIPPEDYLQYVEAGEMLVSLPNPQNCRTTLTLYINEDPTPDDLWYRRLPEGSYTGLLKLPGGRLHLRELSAAPKLDRLLEVPAGDYLVEAIDTDINIYRTEDLVVREFGKAAGASWNRAEAWSRFAAMAGVVAGASGFMAPFAEQLWKSWAWFICCLFAIVLSRIAFRRIRGTPNTRRIDAVVIPVQRKTPSLILVMHRTSRDVSTVARGGMWHNPTHENVDDSSYE